MDKEDSPIRVEERYQALWITLNRPDQRNALTVPMLQTLLDLMRSEAIGRSRCLVLTGAGRAFCAGADLEEWAQAEREGRLETYGWTERAHALVLALHECPIPTLAVIQGDAVGAGLDLALACDLRLSHTGVRFSAGYTRMAYPPDAGSSWFLPRLIGPARALEFLLFDERHSAVQALELGLIHQCAPDPFVLQSMAQDWAMRLAAGPTVAYRQIKSLLRQSGRNELAQQLELERQAGLLCGRTQDAKEALDAVAQRRPPRFRGQ